MSSYSRQFEEYLRDGILAAKNGQRKLAVTLLERAIYINPHDARPYLWLSSTTDDPAEQRELLEKAVAADPANAAARRGLALLTGKIDRAQALPAERVEALMRETGGRLLAGLRLFDVYRGEQIGAGKKSLAYSLTYQSAEKTLTDDDVQRIRRRIVQRLESELGARLRG